MMQRIKQRPERIEISQLQLAGYLRVDRVGELVPIFLKPRPAVELRTIIRTLNQPKESSDERSH